MLTREKFRRLAIPYLRLTINIQQLRKHSTGMKIDMYQHKKTECRNRPPHIHHIYQQKQQFKGSGVTSPNKLLKPGKSRGKGNLNSSLRLHVT